MLKWGLKKRTFYLTGPVLSSNQYRVPQLWPPCYDNVLNQSLPLGLLLTFHVARIGFPLHYIPVWNLEQGWSCIWPLLKFVLPLSFPHPVLFLCLSVSPLDYKSPWERKPCLINFVSFAMPTTMSVKLQVFNKCWWNVFYSSLVARLPMELVYGCSPCGHNNVGIRAVLSQNSVRDPTFVRPTLERGRVESLKTEAVLETFQNDVQKTQNFPHL